MLAREIHLMEEGIFTNPLLRSPSPRKSACALNTGVSEPALIQPHFPTEYLLFCPISLHYSHLHTYPWKEKAIKGRI